MTVRGGLRDRLGKAALAAWGPVALTVTAFLMVSHVVTLPRPADEDRFREGLRSLRRDPARPFLVHVIGARCSCTDGLFAHLLERGAHRGAEELILYVGEDAARRAAATGRGYRFVEVDAAALTERLGVAAAPMFTVLDGEDLGYVGGYYELPATVNPRDGALYASVLDGERPEPLPLYGCAVDPELEAALDPLGLQRLRAGR